MRGLFVTATDTGAGKTEVTAGIARIWRREGRRFRVCKPVATGATLQSGRLIADDAVRLAVAAGEASSEAITSVEYTFAEPAAPPVAAAAAGVSLTLEELANEVIRRQADGSAMLVEGVGGLLCPLTETHTVADLVKRLGLPLVVVARRSLGTLNHTLLTLEVARERGLPVRGVVVSETTPPVGLAEHRNPEELRRRLTVPILGLVAHRPGGHEEEIPGLQAVDWWSLIE